MDGENGLARKITMKKNKNFLIFTNNLFPYQISFDLNSGKYYKIDENKTKEVKNIKPFFAHYAYWHIIESHEFPVYHKIINMASKLSYGNYIKNMGSVLELLRTHLFWEQYLTLNLPVTNEMNYPLTFFPKDIFAAINRAFSLRENFKDEKINESRWRNKYSLPESFNGNIACMCDESELFFKAIRYINTFTDDRDFSQRFSFIYETRDKFSTLVKEYNYEYKNLIEYLCYLEDYDGYDYRYEIMDDLFDYNFMSSKISALCNRKGKYEKYPHFLKSRHAIISKNYRIMKENKKEDFFEMAYNGSLEFTDRKYAIIEPKTSKDILKEASEMHNCVASYIDRIIEGRTKIVFMRERETLDDSLVTVEVKQGRITQAYQRSNTPISSKQKSFLEKYAKNKNLILDIS